MTDYTTIAADFKSLPDDEATAEIDRLATKLAGSDRWATELARMIGVERQTVQNWKGGHVRPPTLAIVALTAMLREKEARAFHAAFQDLHRIATQLDRT